jgi:lysine 2,3-aminomutase
MRVNDKQDVGDRDGRALTSLQQLVDGGLVSPTESADLATVLETFSMRVTREAADLMESRDAQDPIALQYLPSMKELRRSSREISDPIGDVIKTVVPGLIHRYPDRVVLKIINVCPVYCRFCFRREIVGRGERVMQEEDFARALAYIEKSPEVWEVILSGGDPLMLSAQRLANALTRIANIEHVATLRIHTKVPIVDPGRVTAELVATMRLAKPVWVVVHCNHPREVTPKVKEALGRLVDAGIPLLSQTVLLKGVNDDAETLEALFRSLISSRVKPYYLHQLDLAPGTSHFRTPIREGQELVRRLRGRLSGICQPTYVLDIPGGHGKVPVNPLWARQMDDNSWEVTDYLGVVHSYEEDGSPLQD